MGCDYYIYRHLKIEHTKGISYIELQCKRGYFFYFEIGFVDSDNEDEPYYLTEEYKELDNKIQEFSLKPNPDVIIYENNKYAKPIFQEKYQNLIFKKISCKTQCNIMNDDDDDDDDDDVMDTGKLSSFEDIIKITKFEKRYER